MKQLLRVVGVKLHRTARAAAPNERHRLCALRTTRPRSTRCLSRLTPHARVGACWVRRALSHTLYHSLSLSLSPLSLSHWLSH